MKDLALPSTVPEWPKESSAHRIPRGRRMGLLRVARRLIIPVTVSLVLILLLPTFLLGWGTAVHWVCYRSGVKGEEPELAVPVAVSNAPYGGNATEMTSLGYPSDYRGWSAGNGGPAHTSRTISEVEQVFFNVTFMSATNVLTFGPGPDGRCVQGIVAVLQNPDAPGFVPADVHIGSVFSDRNESNNVSAHWTNGPPPLFNASFTQANSPPISTCNEPARAYTVRSHYFHVQFQWNNSDSHVLINFVSSYQSTYTYNFPADFGIWQVDNLSMPGGPGGGWAFSYSPCP